MNNFQGALEVGNHQIIEMHGAPIWPSIGWPYGSYGNLWISTGPLYISNKIFTEMYRAPQNCRGSVKKL